ncbi:MAG TPA: LuxR C-terminal-related transcriptional regulator [Gemmatimonadaceae bacterium]|nr:LuxR C-terminal-related transcriptional regulator [Gemmatimonadaceae bacterium]
MIVSSEKSGYGYRVSARGELRADEARAWVAQLRTHVERTSVRGRGFLLDARGLTWDSVGTEVAVLAALRCLHEAGIGRSAVLADTPRALFELRRLAQAEGLYASQRYFLVSATPDAERAAQRWVAEGVDEAWPRQSERRAELALLLDVLGEALLLCDLDGRPLHANIALQRLLDTSGGAQLRRELELVARGAAPGSRGGAPVERELRVGAQMYRVRRSTVGHGFGGPAAAVLVALQPVALQPLRDDELRERYGLTDREIEVARLLAEGRRNAEVARRLGISPFTARNHTERVLAKLRISNRAKVAAVLTAAA